MNADGKNNRWHEIGDLFQRASEMQAPQRAALLDDACGTDSELRNEVATLLASDNTLAWLKRLVDRAAREIAFVGREIGSYVLLRLLGEGGMGRVFLAARAGGQYQQFVAIKVMHAELLRSEMMLERFRAERQILANLHHPDIARLLDAGMTADGTPYMVMEYVDGLPLDEYCSVHHLPLETKLQLFLRVCSAVECAHKNLVVHRDIKPGNVLVTKDGSPKLVDFGIARLLERGGRAATPSAARLMTPEYASPEQFRGEPITAAADVYALGVLLYELLTGVHPLADHIGNPAEMMRQICDVEPRSPSSIVFDGVSNRELSGDLDRIVLMAMRKQPARRYSSAKALAGDVFASLNGDPVLARDEHG